MLNGKATEGNEVVWVDAEGMSFENTVGHKLRRLIHESGATGDLCRGMRVVLKVNTSEDGYEYGLRPVFLRAMADLVNAATETRPAVCDGLRLVDYWRRAKGNSFLDVARGKGYSNDTLGGHFVINGGFSGDEGNLYPFESRDSVLGGVEVGTAVCRSDCLWVLSHVTLHPLFGLSGALWNGGFECLVGRERTRVLRGVDPYPFNGQRPAPGKLRELHRRVLESNLGVKAATENRIFYVNYLWDVTPQPEYFPFSERPVVGNLGFLASRDPVALDAATFGLLDGAFLSEGGAYSVVQDITGVDFSEVLKDAEVLKLGSAEKAVKQLS
jgi:hypothetical protein